MSKRGVSAEIQCKQKELDHLRERSGLEKNRQRLLDAWDRMRRIVGGFLLAPDSMYAHLPVVLIEDDLPGVPLEEQIHTSQEVFLAQMLELLFLQTRYGHLLDEDARDLLGETVYSYVDFLKRYVGERQVIEPSGSTAVRGELDEPPDSYTARSGGPFSIHPGRQSFVLMTASPAHFFAVGDRVCVNRAGEVVPSSAESSPTPIIGLIVELPNDLHPGQVIVHLTEA